MKKIAFTLILFALTNCAFGQSALPQGQTQLNAGIGLSSWANPGYVGFDYGVRQNVTIGAEATYRYFREEWNNSTYRHHVLGISGNVNYHFNTIIEIPSEWDLYIGASLSYFLLNSTKGYRGREKGGPGLGGHIGGRYFFNDKLGLNLEFGGGSPISGGKLGLTIRL